jgi:hypothetical protein
VINAIINSETLKEIRNQQLSRREQQIFDYKWRVEFLQYNVFISLKYFS